MWRLYLISYTPPDAVTLTVLYEPPTSGKEKEKADEILDDYAIPDDSLFDTLLTHAPLDITVGDTFRDWGTESIITINEAYQLASILPLGTGMMPNTMGWLGGRFDCTYVAKRPNRTAETPEGEEYTTQTGDVLSIVRPTPVLDIVKVAGGEQSKRYPDHTYRTQFWEVRRAVLSFFPPVETGEDLNWWYCESYAQGELAYDTLGYVIPSDKFAEYSVCAYIHNYVQHSTRITGGFVHYGDGYLHYGATTPMLFYLTPIMLYGISDTTLSTGLIPVIIGFGLLNLLQMGAAPNTGRIKKR